MNEAIFFLQAGVLFGASRLFVRGGEVALTLWFVFLCIGANLFVSKEVLLFSQRTTAADSYIIGAFFSLIYLQATFGKEVARRAVYMAFIAQIFFVFLAQLHLAYIPSSQDHMQEGFEKIFALYPRIVAASLTAFFFSQQLDLFLFGFLTKHLASLSFRLRAFLTMTAGQILDTILFSFLALWGHMSDIQGVIIVSLTIKGILLFFSLLFTEKYYDISIRTSS